MKKYIINSEASQEWMHAYINSKKSRSDYHHSVYTQLGIKHEVVFNFIVGTNKCFYIIETNDNIETEAVHVYHHSVFSHSGLKFISMQQFISFDENAELYKKHAEHLTHFKMPGDED